MSLWVKLKFIYAIGLSALPWLGLAQTNPTLLQIAEAFKSGDAEKVAVFFNTQVELNFDDEKANYSKNQAEVLLKEFLTKNKPTSFEYVHQGTAKEGRLYAIAKYKTQKLSFNVYILLKQVSGSYKIDTLDFSNDG
jgi:hypothetical protein